jgi:drug/metabolite transporter (DMT)-like permease
LVILSNFSFAIGNVFISKLEQNKRWEQGLTTMGLGWGALIALPFALCSKHTASLVGFKSFLLPLYLGLIATGLGFYLWNRGVQKISAFPASLIGNFKSPLSVIWGVLLLHESFDSTFLIGFALLFSSALLISWSKKQTSEVPL